MSRRRCSPRRAASDNPPLVSLPLGLAVDAIEVDGETLVVFTFPTRSNSPRELSETEVSVAGLAVRGLTAAQIAACRGVAKATVSSQLQSIYRKLGVASRTELARKLG